MFRFRSAAAVAYLIASVSIHAGIEITGSSPEKLVFSWKLSSIDTASFRTEEGRVSSLTFRESDVSVGRHGEPVLPGVSISTGVPAEGDVSVSFVPSATKRIRLHHPLAVCHDPENMNGGDDPVFNGGWVSRPVYSSFRSMRTARTILCPVQYERGAHTVLLVTGGTGTIVFPKSVHRKGSPGGRSEFEAMLKKVLLNYDVAAGWRSVTGLKKRSASSYPLPYNRKMYYFRIGDGHDGFNEATTGENGVLRIPGPRIQKLFGTVRSSRVQLYGAFRGMLPDTLPHDGSLPDGVHEVPLLRMDENGNDTVDSEDCLLAWVTGSSDWKADTASGEYRFDLDLYDDCRTYWLTVTEGEGLTMEKWRGGSFVADTSVSHFTGMVRLKRSLVRREGNPGDRNWLWRIFSSHHTFFELQLDLPGLENAGQGRLRLNGKNTGGTVSLELGGKELCNGCSFSDGYPVTSWGNRILAIRYVAGTDDEDSNAQLESIDVTYRRKLAVSGTPEVLSIFPSMHDRNRTVSYNLSIQTSQKVYILRVPEDERFITLIDTVRRDGGGTYEWMDTVDPFVRYIVCNEAALIDLPDVGDPSESPASGAHVVRNVRSESNRTDFCIITHEEFLAASDSLARHKKRMGFSSPVVVDVNDIYRFFSGGDKDVAAIRNFIGYIHRYWKNGDNLDYVLLVGVGHYDTKNLMSVAPDFIPVHLSGSFCHEDYFTCVLPASRSRDPQMAIGRLPCTSPEQAWAMVGKIVETEDPAYADRSEWRNRALFVADDDMQGSEYDNVASSNPHHISSDRTATVVDSLWPSIDIRKVYLYEYRWDQSLQKPGASRALINEINNGVGYINFFGHGADVTWTDEYILTGDMVAGMNNAGRYPVVSAFSCSVGKFDVPGTECLSGILVRSAGVGSIASISSTREANATTNENLAKSFYGFLFDTTDVRSIGMAMVAAKIVRTGERNRTYCILGDPSVRAVRPTRRISVSIKDGEKTIDTIAAFQKVTLSGAVQKPGGPVDTEFSGKDAYVALGLFNAPDTAARKDGGEHQDVRYVLPGRPVFLGKTAVVNGRFSQEVLIPQNVSFNRPGVKCTAYAWRVGKKEVGVGYRSGLVFSGSKTVSGEYGDTAGPAITIRPVYDDDRLSGGEASFTDHITSQPPVKFEIELFDENGIDASGIGPDEGVTLEIEDVFFRQNVNNRFQFREGDYRRGIVSMVYEEDAMQPGEYQVLVTARDLLGNLSKARFALRVTEYDELSLDHVLNFPNPMRMKEGTRFYCHTNYNSHEYYNADLRLTIKIYALDGRPLRVIRDARNGEPWDGRDQRGNLLTPDVYLYQIIAEDLVQRKTKKSKVMKLVIHPPR